jgi:hypothetical protein
MLQRLAEGSGKKRVQNAGVVACRRLEYSVALVLWRRLRRLIDGWRMHRFVCAPQS